MLQKSTALGTLCFAFDNFKFKIKNCYYDQIPGN